MGPERSPETTPAPRGAGRGRIVAASILALALIAVAAFSIGRLSAPVSANPSNDSNEAGFARDMQVHHEQAVTMSYIVRDETDDTDVRLLAYDIARTQSQQEGQLYGWLAAWHLPQAAAEPSMTWMTRPSLSGATGHEHASSTPLRATMPGYATDAQLAHLTSLTGKAAAVDYLRLMIAHHQGGVLMAKAILARTTDPVVTAFATGVVASQTSDIAAMRALLATRT
ncbi:DUF305 domain-containing protein [soil metagenome]